MPTRAPRPSGELAARLHVRARRAAALRRRVAALAIALLLAAWGTVDRLGSMGSSGAATTPLVDRAASVATTPKRASRHPAQRARATSDADRRRTTTTRTATTTTASSATSSGSSDASSTSAASGSAATTVTSGQS